MLSEGERPVGTSAAVLAGGPLPLPATRPALPATGPARIGRPSEVRPDGRSSSDTQLADTQRTGSTAPLAETEALRGLLTTLADAAEGARRWTAGDRRAVLAALDQAIDGLTGVRATVLVAEKTAGTWQGRGDRSFEAWRGRTARTGARTARSEVRHAETLQAVPQVGAALTTGQISGQHATTITRLAGTGSPRQQQAVRSSAGQQHLLALAQRHDAETFAGAAARWTATVDPVGLERDHQVQRANRFLHLADTPRGTVIKGQLDTISGHRLRLALEAANPRPAADDERDPGQRAADALDTIASRILADPATTPGAHVPPQVSLILTEATWAAARTELSRRREASAGRGLRRRTRRGLQEKPDAAGSSPAPVPTPTPVSGVEASSAEPVASAPDLRPEPYPPATLEDGTPIPVSELAAALCDCEVTRIVVDAHGFPTDLGRSTRLFTGAMRRAVIARDRHCAWPDCGAPARWGQIHHINWWDRDHGPTSLDNGVLLCGFHHHEVHRRDLTITRIIRAATPGSSPPQGQGGPGSGRPGHRGSDHGPPGSGPPSSGELAAVSYEFRERATGALIGGPDPRGTPGSGVGGGRQGA